jgi:hypothetical protein
MNYCVRQHDFGSGCIEKWAGHMKKNPLMKLNNEVLMMDEYGKMPMWECSVLWRPLTRVLIRVAFKNGLQTKKN